MRKLVSVLFLCSLLFQIFYISGLSLDYKIDLGSYLEKCINKEKPELLCKGKCILMQKIKKAEEASIPGKSSLPENQQISQYINALKDFHFEPLKDIQQSFSPHFENTYFTRFPSSIFRPPQV